MAEEEAEAAAESPKAVPASFLRVTRAGSEQRDFESEVDGSQVEWDREEPSEQGSAVENGSGWSKEEEEERSAPSDHPDGPSTAVRTPAPPSACFGSCRANGVQ